MIIVGLTGGIASGKSFVSDAFKSLGAFVVDADDVYHKLLDTKEMTAVIKEVFGYEFFDDNRKVDLKKLGRYVFSNKAALTKLNAVTHPIVIKEINNIINDVRREGKARLCIVSVPLLFEVGFDKEVEKTIVVTVERAMQIKRLCYRSALTEEEAVRRIDSQMPLVEKVNRASIVIDNNKSKALTETQVESIYKELTS